jgi:hypothetical protein
MTDRRLKLACKAYVAEFVVLELALRWEATPRCGTFEEIFPFPIN